MATVIPTNQTPLQNPLRTSTNRTSNRLTDLFQTNKAKHENTAPLSTRVTSVPVKKVNVLNHHVTFDPTLEKFRNVSDNFVEEFFENFWNKVIVSKSTNYADAIKKVDDVLTSFQKWLSDDQFDFMNTLFDPFCSMWNGLEKKGKDNPIFPKKFQKQALEWCLSLTPAMDVNQKVKLMLADPLWDAFKMNEDDPAGEFQKSAKYTDLRRERETTALLLLKGDVDTLAVRNADNRELQRITAALVLVLTKQTGAKRVGDWKSLLTDTNEQQLIFKTVKKEVGIFVKLLTGRVCELLEAFPHRNVVNQLIKTAHNHFERCEEYKVNCIRTEKLLRDKKTKNKIRQDGYSQEEFIIGPTFYAEKNYKHHLHKAVTDEIERRKFFTDLGEKCINTLFPPAGHMMPSQFFQTQNDSLLSIINQIFPNLLPEARKLIFDYLSAVMSDDLFKTLGEFVKDSPLQTAASQGIRKLAATKLAQHLEQLVDCVTDPNSLKELMATTFLPNLELQMQKNLMRSQIHKKLGNYGYLLALLNDPNNRDNAKNDLVKLLVDGFNTACNEYPLGRLKEEGKIKLAEETIKDIEEYWEEKAKALRQKKEHLNPKIVLKEWLNGVKGKNKPLHGNFIFKLAFDIGKIKTPWWLPRWVVNLFKKTIGQNLANNLEPYKMDHVALMKSVNLFVQDRLKGFTNDVIGKMAGDPVNAPTPLTQKDVTQLYDEQVTQISKLMYDVLRANAGKTLANQFFKNKDKTVKRVFNNILGHFIPEDDSLKKDDWAYKVARDSNRNLMYNVLDVFKNGLDEAAEQVTPHK